MTVEQTERTDLRGAIKDLREHYASPLRAARVSTRDVIQRLDAALAGEAHPLPGDTVHWSGRRAVGDLHSFADDAARTRVREAVTCRTCLHALARL